MTHPSSVGPAPTLAPPDEMWRNYAHVATLIAASLQIVKNSRDRKERERAAKRAETFRQAMGFKNGMPRPLDNERYAEAKIGIPDNTRRVIYRPAQLSDGHYAVRGTVDNMQGQPIPIGAEVATLDEARHMYDYFLADTTPDSELLAWRVTEEPAEITGDEVSRRARNELATIRDGLKPQKAAGVVAEVIADLETGEREEVALAVLKSLGLSQPEVVKAFREKEANHLVAAQEAAEAQRGQPVEPTVVNAEAESTVPRAAGGDEAVPEPWEAGKTAAELAATYPKEDPWSADRRFSPVGADGEARSEEAILVEIEGWNPSDPSDQAKAASAYDQVSPSVRAKLAEKFTDLEDAMNVQSSAASGGGDPNTEQSARVAEAKESGDPRQMALAFSGMSYAPDAEAIEVAAEAKAEAADDAASEKRQRTMVKPDRGAPATGPVQKPGLER